MLLQSKLCLTLFVPVVSAFVGCTNTAFWTGDVIEQMKIDTAGIARLEAKTHNGGIDYVGRSGGEAAANVVVTKRGGGCCPEEAKKALDAVEVFVEPVGEGGKRLAWRWRVPRQPSWGADVSFKIDAPATLAFDAESHNGRIDIVGLSAAAKAVSHNGSIAVQSCGGPLHAETHNGEIDAAYEGDDITLLTHNGEVEATLAKCKTLGGDISSHNGGITLRAGTDLAADLTCTTHNGSIDTQVPFQVQEASRGRMVGKLGPGGPQLNVTTHNGSIRIKKAAL